MSSIQTFDEMFLKRRDFRYYEPTEYFKDIFNKTMILLNEILPNNKPITAFNNSMLSGTVIFQLPGVDIEIEECASNKPEKRNNIRYEISYMIPMTEIKRCEGFSKKNDAWFEEFSSHLRNISF